MSSSNITVHDFVAAGGTSTLRAAQQLAQGRDLAFACSTTDQWVTPLLARDSSAFSAGRPPFTMLKGICRDKLYQYRPVPPPMATRIGMGPIPIPEWGQPSHTNDPDHFRLQDLQDFESTDLQTSLMHPRIRTVAPSPHGKRVQDDGSTLSKPAKRPRLEGSTILNLIPQPHFIPVPTANFRPVDTSKIPPYHKAPSTPVTPYDAAAVERLLSCRFRRAAWLIPVRGSLPWEGASAAAISEDAQLPSRSPSPCLPTPAPQPRVIMWTPDALQHLWAFLGLIQRAKRLGPLSLSFRAASADALLARNAMSDPLWESNQPYCPRHSSNHTLEPLDDFASDICRAQLEGVDYIKVYHDVPYSLSLRNILDAYRYEQANGSSHVPGRSGANDRRIRILKGARLVLTDERSKPALLM